LILAATYAPVEAAHVKTGGMGIKASDFWTVPLCWKHHSEYHQHGKLAFERVYKVNLEALAIAFMDYSPWKDKIREWRKEQHGDERRDSRTDQDHRDTHRE